MYDLVKQELVKKLMTGVKWISSIDVHPQGKCECVPDACLCTCDVYSGDNIILGSYDKRLCWFDLELSTKPYKVMR